MALHLWRTYASKCWKTPSSSGVFFRGAKSRGLEGVVFSKFITLTNGEKLELYRVRISLADFEANIPDDPYSVGEHDVLNTEEARAVEKKILAVWTVEVNNRDKVRIGGE